MTGDLAIEVLERSKSQGGTARDTTNYSMIQELTRRLNYRSRGGRLHKSAFNMGSMINSSSI